MTNGELLVGGVGLVSTIVSTAAIIIMAQVSDSLKNLSARVGNIEKALIDKALKV